MAEKTVAELLREAAAALEEQQDAGTLRELRRGVLELYICISVLGRLWSFHINLKARLNHDMEEKGIVGVCGLPELLRRGGAGGPAGPRS
ncbi:unnamed protein product [Boreogadus saida]